MMAKPTAASSETRSGKGRRTRVFFLDPGRSDFHKPVIEDADGESQVGQSTEQWLADTTSETQ
jgi:hypothetical protein